MPTSPTDGLFQGPLRRLDAGRRAGRPARAGARQPDAGAPLRRSRSRGYTLLEILLVLAVLGLIASLVVARLDLGTPAFRLRAAGRALAESVAQARGESIGRAQAVELHYDLAQGTYWVSVPGDRGAAGEPGRGSGTSLQPGALPQGVRFTDCTFFHGEAVRTGVVTVRFSFLGACAGHLVHLADGAGNSFTVEVLALGAQVNLYDSRWELADATRQ